MSSIRSLIIPNHIGSTLRSLFRVPLNVLVIVILVNLESLGAASVMLLCAAALLFASVLQVRLQAALIAHKSVSPRGHAS